MTFDPTIGPGSIITIVVLVIGLVGGWYTLKAEFREASRRQEELSEKHDRLETDIQAYRLHLSENYVKRTDMREMEDRIQKIMAAVLDPIMTRLRDVDHKLGNINQKIDERVMSMLQFRRKDE